MHKSQKQLPPMIKEKKELTKKINLVQKKVE